MVIKYDFKPSSKLINLKILTDILKSYFYTIITIFIINVSFDSRLQMAEGACNSLCSMQQL